MKSYPGLNLSLSLVTATGGKDLRTGPMRLASDVGCFCLDDGGPPLLLKLKKIFLSIISQTKIVVCDLLAFVKSNGFNGREMLVVA